MSKTIINTSQAPAPIGPYSQSVLTGNLLFVSGQIAINPENGELEIDDISEETHRVMKNIGAILSEAGLHYNDVVKSTIFLSDMDLFAEVNKIYGSYFTDNFPARETVAVKELPKKVHVEISVIASK